MGFKCCDAGEAGVDLAFNIPFYLVSDMLQSLLVGFLFKSVYHLFFHTSHNLFRIASASRAITLITLSRRKMFSTSATSGTMISFLRR